MENINQDLKKTQSIVAFIDILGFKEMVKANSKNYYVYFNKLNDALYQAVNKAIIIQKESLKALGNIVENDFISNIEYRQFSDNLYFSYSYKEDKSDYDLAVYLISTLAAYYQRIMLSKNIYVRGGISDGHNFINEHMIFSSALVNAYDLESKKAIYPRIIISNSILKSLPKNNFIQVASPKMFIKDWANLVFINPFCVFESLGSMLEDNPEISDLLDVFVKNYPTLKDFNNDKSLDQDLAEDDLMDLV